MVLKIKQANEQDAETLSLLARVTFKEAFGYVWTDKPVLKKYLDSTFSVGKVSDSIRKENNIFWIAYANQLPVGYLKLKKYSPYEKISDTKPAQLQKIYILNDYIGHKIGEHLQNEAFSKVQFLGIKTLWLAVWDGNDKAIRFYERHGFRKETKYSYDFESMHFDYEVMTKHF